MKDVILEFIQNLFNVDGPKDRTTFVSHIEGISPLVNENIVISKAVSYRLVILLGLHTMVFISSRPIIRRTPPITEITQIPTRVESLPSVGSFTFTMAPAKDDKS